MLVCIQSKTGLRFPLRLYKHKEGNIYIEYGAAIPKIY